MIPPQEIAKTFQSNHWLSLRLLEGIVHEESCLLPDFDTNCINWVLGHIINGRNEALKYLGKTGVWAQATSELYRTGSDPITPETALNLRQLLADLDETQADLEFALAEASGTFLDEIVETRFGKRPRGEHVASLGWHETYHLGQFELLRSMVLGQREEQLV